MNYYRKRSWQSVLSVTQHVSYCRLLCKYPLKCLVGRLISRRIGFFIQTDWVIKFLVGVSQVMKWEKLFVLSAKKTFRCDNQGLPQLLQHARGQSHKTLAIEILGGSQMVFHLLSQQNLAKPLAT